ncbi:hypothetical protein HZH68_012712 [Vespula germanica]|uniref:BTB domain-containing protein n=1 Tax=Vespula germanica TaxID=30212 RepID=A0A834MWG6_VESGE|nr:hypothetical protein HZH68_012712 [Vespula germanica]
MGSRAVAVGAVAGAAGVSGEAGLAGVPRLLEDLARLSEDKDTADIVFLLGRDETPVYAHRIILQARLLCAKNSRQKHSDERERRRALFSMHCLIFPPSFAFVRTPPPPPPPPPPPLPDR